MKLLVLDRPFPLRSADLFQGFSLGPSAGTGLFASTSS